jgi:4-amino-4-deoxy-L-arabinose transferase-like glycosyltransferase
MLLSIDNQLTTRAYLLLALLAALIFLPGQAQLPVVDRDEARFTQATKQMVQSGDYADIKYQNESRYKKPIGIYWLQSAAIKISDSIVGTAPTDIWAYRLPSYTSAIGSVVLTAAIGNLLFNGPVGALAGIMMAGSLILNVEARLAKTDATLLFTILLAQFALFTIWRREARSVGYAALFWAAMAAGALVKGPIIFLPVLSTIIGICVYERRTELAKKLQPLWGVPLMLALIAPWFIAITLKSGGAFWAEAVGHDLLGKVATGKESHGLPPGYYLATFWATFWPAAPLIALAAPAIWRRRREAEFSALLAWIVPTWLVFEAVMTKLPHYTMPTFPALAILSAAVYLQGDDDNLLIPRWWKRLVIAITAFVTLGLVIGFAALPIVANGTIPWVQIAVGVLVLFGFAAQWLRRTDVMKRALLNTLLAALFLGTLFGITLPGWTYIWPAKQVADALVTQTDCAVPYLISAQFNEPSLVFHVGTQTTLNGNGAFAAPFVAASPCQFALVDKTNETSFVETATAIGLTPQAIAHIKGFSFGGGDVIDMTLYKKATDE